MKLSDLKSVGTLGNGFGVKAILYGGAGTGKTPLAASLSDAVICAPEPGLMSVQNLNTLGWKAFTRAEIIEFFNWFFGSKESDRFQTLVIDSVSELTEIILTHYKKKNTHGMKAYGEANEEVLGLLRKLYFLEGKNILLTAKQDVYEVEEPSMDGPVFIKHFRPYFPGRELNIKVPHLYDSFWHIERIRFPGQANETLAIRTQGTKTIMARDRSGKLDMFERPDLNYIFQKINA